ARFRFDFTSQPHSTFADVALVVDTASGTSPVTLPPLGRPDDWIHLANSPPVFKSASDQVVLSNPPGIASSPFSRQLVPIERFARYHIAVEARSVGPSSSQNYLAIAWYDAKQTLMFSRDLRPTEFAYPSGWTNGDYSYFGLTGAPVPRTWTTYTVSFGLGEGAEIPREAAFFRVGALLNQDIKAAASTELRSFRVLKKAPRERYILVAPRPTRLYSSSSTAGRLSGHWLPQHVAIDHTGSIELGIAATSYFHEQPQDQKSKTD
ncbi:MAG TPA: hypothetical protein VHS96_11915, partial [Bacteroidia bacterium]|nr:hypothetical protein [Bacteroidia bacterium]